MSDTAVAELFENSSKQPYFCLIKFVLITLIDYSFSLHFRLYAFGYFKLFLGL